MRRSCNLRFRAFGSRCNICSEALRLTLSCSPHNSSTGQRTVLSCLLKSSGIIERFRRSICSLLIPNCAKLLAGIMENKKVLHRQQEFR